MKKTLRISLVLVLFFLTGCKRASQSLPIPIDIKALPPLSMEEIIRLNNGMPELTYDAATGSIKELRGRYSPVLIHNEQDAVSSLASIQVLMGFDSLEFTLIDIEENRLGEKIYILQQLYCGLPVSGGVIRVTADVNAVASRVDGIYRKGISVETIPQFSEADICRQVMLGRGERIQNCDLIVYVDDQQIPWLSWRITTYSKDPLNCRTIYLDAQNGTELISFPNNIS